ncbi:zinc finger X-linked protein ZXDA-like isoform X2 [Ambystoma mexicanum]|uniref:zinc finger X-linked protein ZXDA-like isoform X2 n=1 Tax=Ambystoma mexicanum TaxID=8296 RepID=UPI0037E76FB7
MRGVDEAPGAVASSSPALLQCARRQEATTAMTESEAAQHLQTKPAQECPGGPQTPDWALHSVQLEAAPGRTGTFYGTVTIDDQRLTVRIQDGLLSLEAREPSGGSSASDLQNLCDAGLDQLVLVSCESEPRKSGASHVLLGDPTSGDTTGVPTVAPQQDVDSMCSTVEDGIAHGQLANIFIDENGEVRLAADGFGRKGLVLVFNCPQADCRKTFDKKHKLKLHLLTQHTSEEQRPFRCSVEGCSWSFTTAYKLKRHLQSHGNLRPYTCPLEGCGKTFTTVYNLKAHGKTHELGDTFKCEVCEERFPSLAKLTSHRKMHFEPNKPYVCEFPGCEKMFTTVSALFSHNRAHFREIEQFTCSFPGCNKQYDKACRLKIHLRSHTGERPFICDFDGCGWSFTSMSKLLRHNRKHADDRRFTCHIEGCGKSFTRAEHLKGHSIIHLGTKPFECPVEGCCAKFSARSSLYIHSKKHLQDVTSLKAPCPVSSCHKAFTSKHSMKTHMVKQHNFSQDLLTQLEATSSLTPSSELSGAGLNDQNNLDLASLFSSASSNSPGIGTDMALVNSGILTIDAASVGSTLGGNLAVVNHSLGQPIDPLLLVAGSDMPNSLDTSLLLGAATSVLQQSTLNLDDVQTVSAEALGSMASLSMQSSSQDLHGLTVDTRTLLPSSSLGGSNTVPELLTTVKVEGNLLDGLDVAAQQEGNKVVTQFVFPNPTGSYSAQKEMDLSTVTGSSFLESVGSARTDYRAIQLAKNQKQKGSESSTGTRMKNMMRNKS